MIKDLRKAVHLGAVHIISSSLINKILLFSSSVFLVRLMTKEEYGIWSYALNIMNLFLLLRGFGASSGVLQFVSQSSDSKVKKNYLFLGFILLASGDLLAVLAMQIFGMLKLASIYESNLLLQKISFIPLLLSITDLSSSYLRATFKNRVFSYLSVLGSSSMVIFSVLGLYLFHINGLIVFRYIAVTAVAIIALYLIRDSFDFKIIFLSKKEIIKFLKYSVTVSMTNAMSSILLLIDTFLVGLIIKEGATVASYKTATLIPFALNFLPMSIIQFLYPYIAKNNKDLLYVKNNYYKTLKILGLINLSISISLILTADFLFPLIFSSAYKDSIIIYKVLALGYFFAGTFRIPSGNFIASLGNAKVNFYISMISGSFNIILDIWLIKKYGSMGAAIATVSIFILSGAISNGYLLSKFKKIAQ
ncbi:MAG: oligosaccharide flippase family protein [Candidatus Cloacimonetes bacterium]|nr:oligosaccharide flippase family protein [Candidatus Cloacimonadota bacterium]